MFYGHAQTTVPSDQPRFTGGKHTAEREAGQHTMSTQRLPFCTKVEDQIVVEYSVLSIALSADKRSRPESLKPSCPTLATC